MERVRQERKFASLRLEIDTEGNLSGAMALHCVWSTQSFSEALLKVINLRGDSDTVGSITGQIAGALYGVEDIPTDWIATVQRWDRQGEILHTAAKLFRHSPVVLSGAESP